MPPGWWNDEPEKVAQLAEVKAPEGWPSDYFHVALNLHARTFVLSIERTTVLLKAIQQQVAAIHPVGIEDILQELDTRFPNIRDLRNSIGHIEDRLRGVHGVRKKQPIEIQPVFGLSEGRGSLFTDFLNKERGEWILTWTIADGSVAYCSISETTLTVVADLSKKALARLE